MIPFTWQHAFLKCGDFQGSTKIPQRILKGDNTVPVLDNPRKDFETVPFPVPVVQYGEGDSPGIEGSTVNSSWEALSKG